MDICETPKRGIIDLPKRPPLNPNSTFERTFKPQPLISNYFKVSLHAEKVVLYSAAITPTLPRDNRVLVNSVVQAAKPKIEQLLGSKIVFAGGNCIFATEIPSTMGPFVTQVDYQGITYTFSLTNTRTFQFSDLKENGSVSKKCPLLSFLNNSLKNILRDINYTQIGKSRKYFNPRSKEVIGNTQLTLFKGFETSFNVKAQGLLLLINTASKIVRNESVLTHINNLYKNNQSKSKDEKRDLVTSSLLQKTVMANYGSSLYWTIEEVRFGVDLRTYVIEGTEKTLQAYYKEKYNLTITNFNQPLLVSNYTERKNKRSALLIPEFCLMTGIPENFDERSRMEISKTTIRPASDRLNNIKGLLNQLQKPKANNRFGLAELNDLGIQIAMNPMQIQGVSLGLPLLHLGSNQTVDKGREANFQLFRNQLWNTKTEIMLHLVVFAYNTDNIQQILRNTATNIGLKLSLKKVNLGNFDVRKAEADIVSYLHSGHNATIVWILLPAHAKNLYKSIKKAALRRDILTQVSLDSKLNGKGFQSVVTKILLQIAAKSGNVLWKPSSPPLQKARVMMIGLDRGSEGNIAFCSTTDNNFTKFHSGIMSGEKNDPVMGKIVLQCLRAYQDCNELNLPEEIVIVREGCSEGQRQSVYEFQVGDILSSLSIMTPPPKLLFSTVDKKPSQKFFQAANGEAGNPQPGTLIRAQITEAEEFDFYLIAQQVSARATATPTYYRVLYNDTSMSEAVVEYLFYAQCFNYMNWNGSVRVPAVLQYASKLIKFKANTEGSISDGLLSNSLYFI